MVSIATSVFKAVLGLLVNKGRDLVAKRLKEGDVTDQQFRSFVVREIDDIKSKLDGIARKDLLASVSFFKEGLVYLYKVFDSVASEKDGQETVQQALKSSAAATTDASVETAVSLAAEKMKKVQLTDQGNLDDSTRRALSDTKERFRDARRKATEAFSNEALSTTDRILAMRYRVMATLLEKVDNPIEALPACALCLEELHAIPTVQKSFNVQLRQGKMKCVFNRAERKEITTSVCRVNRVIFYVTVQVDEGVNLLLWPCIDIGEDNVDPLRDSRLLETLRQAGLEHIYLAPWSFGQEGEKEHKLSSPCCIDVNTQGHLVVVDSDFIGVFDSRGKLLNCSRLPPDRPSDFRKGIATDQDDNIYLFFGRWSPVVYVFDKHLNLHHQFSLTFCLDEPLSITVNNSNKLLQILRRNKIEMYDTLNGQCLRSFSFGRFISAHDITVDNDGSVMVLANNSKDFKTYIHVFNTVGKHLFSFNMKDPVTCQARRIAFQPGSEQVVIMFGRSIVSDEYPKLFQIYTKQGEFVRSVHCGTEDMIVPFGSQGMAVTRDGRIAVCVLDKSIKKYKVLVV